MDTAKARPDSSAPIALVTGATSGIGFSVTRELARLGWTVLVHGRTRDRASETIERAGATPGTLIPVVADIETRAGVRELVDQVHATAPGRLDLLLNNAGAAFDRHRLTADGVERTMAVNHLSVADLTFGLQPLLESAGAKPNSPARVIMTTSYLENGAHPAEDWTLTEKWTQMRAYRTSKLTDLAFTYALAREWADRISVVALDPGSVRTGFQRRAGGPLRLIGLLGKPLLTPPEKPARAIVTTATRTPPHPTGSYIKAARVERPATSSARSRDLTYQREVFDATRRYLDGYAG